MTMLALMYHRARGGPMGNSPAMLDAHFARIAERHACVLPGDPLSDERLNVCITFDDAYADFYHDVFPLLRRHKLRALLAVPLGFVSDLPGDQGGMTPGDRHCTWTQLREMAHSGHVKMASHGFTHRALGTNDDVNLYTEVLVSQTMLSSRLDHPVDTFVFPYGKFSAAALNCVRQSYRYAFRIGGAANEDWSAPLLYRVNADDMKAPEELFTPQNVIKAKLRRHWNRLRGR